MSDMNHTHYNVFINYRRDPGRDYARIMQLAFMVRGLSVFFDYDSLQDGEFDKAIYDAIENSDVFVSVYSDGFFDRCQDPKDWVRSEIEHAFKNNKKIVPIARTKVYATWHFPDNLPPSLERMRNRQITEIHDGQYFKDSIDNCITERFPDALKQKVSLSELTLSTVLPPSWGVFVGRDRELVKLHDFLSTGCIPVIIGPSGTGKSELVFQYTARHKADYPGGLFQIDMESVNNWDDVFHHLLATPGVDMKRFLDLSECDNNIEFDSRQREPSTQEIVAALHRRTERVGSILLVLDNMESTKPFLQEPVLRRISLSRGVAVIATARTSDIRFRPTDRAVDFPLSDLASEEALKLLLSDHPAESDTERKAAARIAQLLDFRPLHLRSVPALLDDPYSPYGSYALLEEALREDLGKTVEAAMTDYGEGGRTPSVLWNLTCMVLSRQPMGKSWIELARIASFFSSDGFKKHLLRHLWGTLVAPEVDTDRAFDQALDILIRHGLISCEAEKLRMHRLTAAILRQKAKETNSIVEAKIGKALANYAEMAPMDWLALADNAAILACIPDSVLVPNNTTFHNSLQFELLRRNTAYNPSIHFENFTGHDWAILLTIRPQFADCCPWAELDGVDWADLLEKQPQFADRCSLDGLGDLDLINLLGRHPQFAERCPWKRWNEEWNGGDWTMLLIVAPQFAKCCLWEKLDGANWALLLSVRPEFADHCQWDKLKGEDWVVLLGGVSPILSRPQFADHCPWDKLDGRAWAKLLGRKPQFADRCSWEKLSRKDWIMLLKTRPQFADYQPTTHHYRKTT